MTAPSDRAWRAPYDLEQRLGHLELARLAADPEAVRTAIAAPPALHRYTSALADWVVGAATRVLDGYAGDAAALWSDGPTRAQLRARLLRFEGIGPTKANRAMALLEDRLRVRLAADEAGDVA